MVYLESQITTSSSGICRRDPVPKHFSKDSDIFPARRQNLAGVSRERAQSGHAGRKEVGTWDSSLGPR